MSNSSVPIEALCDDCLDWARKRNYEGYDPYDGLNSPYLSSIATNLLTRLVAIHAVNKSPVNLRGLLRIPRERNPKGIALFVLAYLERYRSTGREAFREEANRLLEWLESNQSPGFDSACWGYNFDWQNGRKFFLPKYHPSIVVTVFCGRAFLEYYAITEEEWALDVARSAASFIRTSINEVQVDGYDVHAYTPYDSFVLVNTNALAGGFFYDLSTFDDDLDIVDRVEELFSFVVDLQTDSGAWYYAVPAAESHLSHDNFHTGFVLESLHGYAMDHRDSDVRLAYEEGLRFYRGKLFEANGAPRFEAHRRYPHDAHAAAQAIITLAQSPKDSDTRFAETVAEWTIRHLYDDDGYFYRRKGRLLTDKTPYMRWSQAWMCRALATLAKTIEPV